MLHEFVNVTKPLTFSPALTMAPCCIKSQRGQKANKRTPSAAQPMAQVVACERSQLPLKHMMIHGCRGYVHWYGPVPTHSSSRWPVDHSLCHFGPFVACTTMLPTPASTLIPATMATAFGCRYLWHRGCDDTF